MPEPLLESSARRKALLCTLALTIFLTVAEGGSRLLGPVEYRKPAPRRPDNVWRELVHRRSDIEGLAYELSPGVRKQVRGIHVSTNSAGMRDRELSIERASATRRIAVVGDSVTFGLGVEAQETYPKVLEKLLNERSADDGQRFETLNFGVVGYSSRDEALVSRHKVARWRPDVVLVGYVLNDPEIEPIQPLHKYFDRPSWWQYSDALRRVAEAKHGWDLERLGRGDYFRYLHEHRAKWRSAVQAFAGLSRLSESEGFEVYVVIFPRIPVGAWSEYAYRDLHEQVATAAREQGLVVKDLLDEFVRYEPGALRLSSDDAHPTPLGHAVASEAILDLFPLEEPAG